MKISSEQFKKLAVREDHWVSGMRRGIEREALRITPEGKLAQTPHPQALGPAATHPAITTDYSESLMEFITPLCETPEEAVAFLEDMQRETLKVIGDELLWPNSMPCWLPEQEQDIPLAQYGDSDIGRLKTIYRQGLAHRYGRRMQTIAGVHYNWSLPEAAWQDITGIEDPQAARNRGYFLTLRGFRRNYWMLMWLFGASPAMDRSFFGETERGNASRLVSGATSLRMSDLGYHNKAQQTLGICFNALDSYAESLSNAVHQPWPEYQSWGTLVEGEWQQLNENLLQIENEYYSVVRPKQLQESGERPVKALRERGVSWLEVRCLDVDPWAPAGISTHTIRFLDCFLLACALSDNPRVSSEECLQLEENQHRIATEGRTHGQRVWVRGEEQKLTDAAEHILKKCRQVAEMLDEHEGGGAHVAAIDEAAEHLLMPKGLPSARIERKVHEKGFMAWTLGRAEKLKARLLEGETSPERLAQMAQMREQAIEAERTLPRSSPEGFNQFILDYVNQPTG
ncbi:MAG: glutamate--cysteine ligase [Litorivicinus sp.]